MAWSWLQSASASPGVVGTASVTFTTANLSAGSKIICVVAFGATGSDSVTSVKDGAGNTLTSLATASGTVGGNFTLVELFAMDTPAGDVGTKPTISATVTTVNSPSVSILVQEVSGLLPGNTTAMIDGTAGTIQSSIAAAGNTTLPSYASAASNEYLVNIFGDQGNSVTFTAPGGYTADTHNINGSGVADIGVSYKNSTGGTETGTYALNAADAYGIILVAFKLLASGAAESPPPLLTAPGLQSPMTLTVPPRYSRPAPPQQQPAPAPQLIPPGLQSPMSLAVPPRPATQAPPAPPAPPTGTPAPAPIPPGLQSPMVLAEPPRYSQPAPPQQQPAPAPQLIPPGLQSPMSLAVPPRPATSAPPPPPVTAVSVPPPLLTPPGLQSPMALAVPTRPATAAPPAPPPAVSPGTAQVHPPGRMSPMSIGLPLVQPPQGAPPPGPPPPTPPIPSGVIFGGQAAGGDRDHEIRVFRSIMPGEIPATGAELPKLQGRAWGGPLPERADDTLHDWLEEQAPPEPGPGVAEIARDEAERLARGLYELGRIIAPEPYMAPGKGKCGQPRKIGREWLTCKLRAGHGGMHSDRGVRWG